MEKRWHLRCDHEKCRQKWCGLANCSVMSSGNWKGLVADSTIDSLVQPTISDEDSAECSYWCASTSATEKVRKWGTTVQTREDIYARGQYTWKQSTVKLSASEVCGGAEWQISYEGIIPRYFNTVGQAGELARGLFSCVWGPSKNV